MIEARFVNRISLGILLMAGYAVSAAEGPVSSADYYATLDNSTQPYGLCVPASYDGRSAMPLVVVLHTADPAGAAPAQQIAGFSKFAQDNDCIVCMPGGRGSDIATDIGMNDALAVVADVSTRYQVDPNRVSLLGYGLGGVAAWRLACFYPDKWAAVAIVDGPANLPPRRSGLSDRILPGMEPDLLGYAVNLKHVPVLIHVAKEPSNPVGVNWQTAAARLGDLTYEVECVTHESIPARGSTNEIEPRLFQRLLQRSRSRCPTAIAFRTPSMSYGKAYWGEILQAENPEAPAELRVNVSGTGGMIVECSNTLRFAINLGAGQYPDGACVDVMVNKYNNPVMCPLPRRYVIGPVGQDPWLWQEVTNASAGLVKKAGLEGPMSRVFSSDFTIVAATGQKDPTLSAAVLKTVESLRSAWRSRYGCDPVVVQDTQITPEAIQNRHLVLVGIAQTNSPLARVAAALPVRAGLKGGVIAGSSRFEGNDLGFGVVYPNPANPSRLVLALDATSPRAMEQLSGTCTFRKDYEVFQAYSNRAAKILAEGVFDSKWALPESK